MSFYIACPKKRGDPRIDVRVCQKECEAIDECEAYADLLNPHLPVDEKRSIEPKD